MFLSACIALPAYAAEISPGYPYLPQGYSSIRVFDRNGLFVGRIISDKRYWVGIERIPPFLQKALVSVEDARFYEHGGIDVQGIARALVKDVAKGRLAEGGSTITQQLVKNKYFTGEKTLDRKLKEGILAIEFEEKYTKNQILEMYFNEIYYGNGAWGIAQAARLYFDKNPEELTDAECAMLAGIPKNPARYNPWGKSSEVMGRRDIVLKRMLDLKQITSRQRKQLRTHPPSVIPREQASYYLALVRSRLQERFGASIIDQGGLEVYSALDLKLQKIAEKVMREGVRKISPELQGAFICLEPSTGDLLAMVGDVDAKHGGFNRALFAKRQPGSAIKPVIYAAALEEGVTAASIWDDTPVAYDRGGGEVWKPLNYGGEQRGALSLRQALAFSSNVVSVKLLNSIGIKHVVETAAGMGLFLNASNDLSLALGTEEVTPLELSLAYAGLANNGPKPAMRPILSIYDRTRRLRTDIPSSLSPGLSPASSFIITSMLKDVMEYGTARSLKKFGRERPSAGKTGTTNDYRDAWFIGYTPRLLAGVWVGYDRPRPGEKGFTGGGIAAPIWGRFMSQASVATNPVVDFLKPETVKTAVIDPATGLLATDACPEKREEFFIAGTEPATNCTLHVK